MPNSIENIGNYKGSKSVLEIYLKSVADLNKSYADGLSFCLAGLHGTAKTTCATNILKKAVHKNFTALYSTLSDIVNTLVYANSEDKYLSRKELTEVDFLVIDEMDGRFFSGETAADLFGRTLESILRTRLQNRLPIIIVSNSPNPIETFHGALKQSLESLMTKLPVIPIIGVDIRKMQVSPIQ